MSIRTTQEKLAGGGGGGGSIDLKTNGVTNSDQTKLDIVGGVHISAMNSGGVTTLDFENEDDMTLGAGNAAIHLDNNNDQVSLGDTTGVGNGTTIEVHDGAQTFHIKDGSLPSASNGYVWSLTDQATGEGAWHAAAGGSTWGSITGTLSAQTDLDTALSGKEPTISSGTSAQYWRGDKSWQTLNQAAVSGLTTASSPSFTGLTLSGLSSGIVPFTTTGGQFTSNANFNFNNANTRLFIGGTTDYTSKLNILTGAAEKGVVIRRASSPSVNAFEVQDNSGNGMFTIGSDATTTIRSKSSGNDGYFALTTGVNPTLTLGGDTTNGYYPTIDIKPLNNGSYGGQIASNSTSGGFLIQPRGGPAIMLQATTTLPVFTARSTNNSNTAKLFSTQSYQGVDHFMVDDAGAFNTYGGGASGIYGLKKVTLNSATASAGGAFAAGTYYYVVTAYNDKKETLVSNEVSVVVTLNQQVTLSFTNSNTNGLLGYKIYRSTVAGTYGATSLVGTTPYYNASYVDSGSATTTGTPPTSHTHVGFTIQQWDGQSGDFMQFTNSGGTALTKIKSTGAISVPDDAYDATSWDGNTEVPTKNAVRDKIEALSLGAGMSRSRSSISTNTTAGSSANTDYVYFITASLTLTMPTAVSNNNRYSIKNNYSAAITINTTSSQTIDGSTTYSLPAGNAVDLISDGSNWGIF